VKRSRLSGAALAVAALVAAMVASAAYGITTAGVQGQLDFRSCVSGTGADTCTPVNNALGQPSRMGLSSDESRLFVVSHASDAVSIFVRNRASGALEALKANQKPCTTQTGAGGTNGTICEDGHGLDGPVDVAAGGSAAYIVSDGSNSLAVLSKDNQGGAWKELPNDPGNSIFYCLAATTADGCQATSVPQTLVDPASVANDGSRVYVGGPGSIAVFSSGTKGRIKQLTSGTNNQDGCVTDDGSGGDCADGDIPGTVVNMAISRDSKNLYAVTDADSLLVFSKSSTGVLTQRQTLAVPNVSGLVGVAVDAASKATSVYVAGSNSIGVFTRDKNTGLLSQPGTQPQVCINAAGSGGCTAASGLGQIGALVGIAVYKTNRFAYAAGVNGLGSFARNKTTAALTPLAGQAACTTETGGACLAGKGIGGLTDIQTTATKHEYVTGTTFNSVVATHLGG
jgi:hypothetical protein